MSDGYCECGCGERAPIAKRTATRYGHVKGQPVRFINGHNTTKRRDWTETPSGCWEWNGTLSIEGYGVLRVNYKQIKAHRWVYEQQVGPVPADKAIDHLCGNKRCVNPLHLEIVTASENSKRHWAQYRA